MTPQDVIDEVIEEVEGAINKSGPEYDYEYGYQEALKKRARQIETKA